MEFDHSFSVAAPIDAVWAAMTDIERIVPCVPNARVTGRAGADGYDVEVTFAVGPLETTAGCRITLAERDDATRREVLTVLATDSGGDMPADASITVVLTQATDRTDAAMHSCVEVSGVAALIGADTLAGFAADTIATFAANLEALLARVPRVPRVPRPV